LGEVALFEPVTVSIQLEDVDVMGEPVEQRAGQALGGEDAGPSSNGRFDVTMVEPRS
jgi:hypothetical protein